MLVVIISYSLLGKVAFYQFTHGLKGDMLALLSRTESIWFLYQNWFA